MTRTQPNSWEGIAALACAAAVWVLVIIPDILVYGPAGNLFQGCVLIVGTAFGIGLSISGLRTPGTRNKILACLALLLIAVYLLPTPLINLARAVRTGNWQYVNPW